MRKHIITAALAIMMLSACGGSLTSSNTDSETTHKNEANTADSKKDAAVHEKDAADPKTTQTTFNKEKALAAWNAQIADSPAEPLPPELWAKAVFSNGKHCWVLKSGFSNELILSSQYKVVAENFGGPVELEIQSNGYIVENIAQGTFAQTTYYHVSDEDGIDEIWCHNLNAATITFRRSYSDQEPRKSTEEELNKHISPDAETISDLEFEMW